MGTIDRNQWARWTGIPTSAFGDPYHKRWRIEEAFKWLKHRLNLEHVSGLSQQAVV
ncbi:transposase [Massilia sp. DWR3-1-1]|uniref:transposase n=1 Tax=Massilia sp. DWR3-1-1 TaxID=2804559 RepID=UPI003CF1CAA6